MNLDQNIRCVTPLARARRWAFSFGIVALLTNLMAAPAMAGTYDGAMGRTNYVVMTGDVNGDGQNDVLLKAVPKIVMIPLDDDLSVPIPIPVPSPTFALISMSYGNYTLVVSPSAEILASAQWKAGTQQLAFADASGGSAGSVTITAASSDQASFVIAMAGDTGQLALNSTTPPAAGAPNAGASSSVPIPVVIDTPYLTNPDAGTLPGTLSAGNDGAAAYSVDLVVPPGTAGMAPKLSLNYSSNGNNGMVGLGWNLSGLSTIHRCAKTIAQDGSPGRIAFDSADRLCLDGMRLLRYDGSGSNPDTVYWQNPTGAQYRTEIEGFARITRQANGGFKVELKNGSIQYYGIDANNAIAAQGRTDGQPLLWALARTEDRSGNYMSFEYSLDTATGEYLPKQIRYGANSVAAQIADLAVRFSYEGRTDAQIQYMGGSRNDMRNRLTHVKTFINTAADGTGGALARDYTIRYVDSANSGRSLVDSLQVCGEDGKCLPKTQMGWGSAPVKLVQKFAFQQQVNGDNENIPLKSVSGNFDGSGRTTIFYPMLGSGPCVGCPSMIPRPFTGSLSGLRAGDDRMLNVFAQLTLPAGTNKFSEAVSGDLDGNGRDDLVLVDIGTRKWAYCLSIDSTDQNPVFAACQIGGTLPASRPNAVNPNEPPSLVSLRNNGKVQVVSFDGASNLYVCGLENSVMQCAISVADVPAGSPSFDLIPIDLSKQGMTDFYTRWRDTNNAYGGMMLCNFLSEKLTCKNIMNGTFGSLSPADMNGDGLTDMFFDRYLCLSKETGVDCRTASAAVGTTMSFVGAANFTGDGIARFWSTLGTQPAQSTLCQIVDGNSICRPIDTSAIPQASLDKYVDYASDRSAIPYHIDETGIPASLNCSGPYFQPNQYVQDCWIGSAVTPANQDKLISVVNGVGQREEVDYARGNDTAVYSRYATINSVAQRPVYPQLSAAPGTIVKALRHSNGQGGWISNSYRYAGAMFDAGGRGSLGFTTVSVTDANGMINDSTFSQSYPYVGMPLHVVKRNATCTLDDTTNTLAITVGFPYISRTSSTQSLDCLDARTIVADNEYTDGWGNLNKQTVTTTAAGKSFVIQTVSIFDTVGGINTRSGLPKSVVVTKTDPVSGTLSRTVEYEYETNGLIKSQTVEPNISSLLVKTTFGRDRNLFGIVNTQTQTWINPACAEPAWMAIKNNNCISNMSVVVSDVSYDAKGRFVSVTKNALGQSQTLGFDPKSGITTLRKDVNQLATTWSVDSLGRITVEKTPDGNEKRTYLKDCQGACPNGASVVQVLDFFHDQAHISTPQVVYLDSAGHTVRTMITGFDGSAAVTDQRFDVLGRLSEVDWPRFNGGTAYLAKRLEYDMFNRITKTTSKDAGGTEHSAATEYQGLTVQQTNLNAQKRTEIRDALGQLIEVQDSNKPVRGVTKFVYDPFGSLGKTTDPNGNVIVVEYDRLGRRTKLSDPDLGVIVYGVDPIGRTWSHQSPKQRAANQKTYTEFDVLGRTVGRYEPDLESHWLFDSAANGIGQLAEAFTMAGSNKDYSRTHTYDPVGRPLEITQKLSDGSYRSRTDYDDWGRPVTSTYQRGNDKQKVFSTRYNAYGYKARIERGNLVVWKATAQDASNRPIKITLGNGLVQSKDFNKYTDRLDQADVSLGSAAQLQEGYAYDLIGNATTRTQFWNLGGFTEILTYDELNRLRTSKIGNSEQVFTYDLVGNLTSKTGTGTYTYPTQGPAAIRPHAVRSVSSLEGQFTYDDNGNMVSRGANTASWTSFDMPIRLAKGSVTADFVYGPEHQRTKQTRSDGATVVYAGAQEVETKAGVTTVKTYWPDGIGVEIDRGTSPTEMSWTHLDRLGSPVALTNETGAIREKLEYDVWGKRRSTDDHNSTPDSLDGKTDNRGFTGHEMLDQLDLVHMNGRVYDPLIGKFLSGDPLVQDPTNGQNYNRYSYVLNNPTNMTDPTGFACQTTTGSYICEPERTAVGELNGDMSVYSSANAAKEGASASGGKVLSGKDTASGRVNTTPSANSGLSKTYFIGGAADKYDEFGQSATHIMGDVQAKFAKDAPPGASSAYYGYQDRDEIVKDASALHKDSPETSINLVGHSRGAALALNMASNEFMKAGIPINLIIAIDPVGTRFTTPGLWMPDKLPTNVGMLIDINANPIKRDITDRIAWAGGHYGDGAKQLTSNFYNLNFNHGQANAMFTAPLIFPGGAVRSARDFLMGIVKKDEN